MEELQSQDGQKAYRESGTKQLLKRSHEGRKASLPQSIQIKLIEKLISGQYKTAKEIQTWFKSKIPLL